VVGEGGRGGWYGREVMVGTGVVGEGGYGG
jgi:hypothetical protein